MILSHFVRYTTTLRVLLVCYVRYARFPQMLCACVPLCGLRFANGANAPRAIARNTSCYVCLLCPLRTISANATRLRLSLLVVVPRKFCRKAKDFAKGKSVPNDTDFLGGEGWIRTTEVTDNRFTVCSLWPLGNLSVWSW